jgi:hypothetical protein
MPRTRQERVTEWKIYVPLLVAAKIEHLLMDPLTHKPFYGARGYLVTSLLKGWLSTREGAGEYDEHLTDTELEQLRKAAEDI